VDRRKTETDESISSN